MTADFPRVCSRLFSTLIHNDNWSPERKEIRWPSVHDHMDFSPLFRTYAILSISLILTRVADLRNNEPSEYWAGTDHIWQHCTLPSTSELLLFLSVLAHSDILYTFLLTLPQQVTWLSRDWPSAVVSAVANLSTTSFAIVSCFENNVNERRRTAVGYFRSSITTCAAGSGVSWALKADGVAGPRWTAVYRYLGAVASYSIMRPLIISRATVHVNRSRNDCSVHSVHCAALWATTCDNSGKDKRGQKTAVVFIVSWSLSLSPLNSSLRQLQGITTASDKKCHSLFTALHGMQTRSCDENSVRASVRPSVRRVNCDKTAERYA